MTPKPASRVIIQAADNTEYYSAVWDATLDITLKAGSGQMTLVRQGNTTIFTPADASATNPTAPLVLTMSAFVVPTYGPPQFKVAVDGVALPGTFTTSGVKIAPTTNSAAD